MGLVRMLRQKIVQNDAGGYIILNDTLDVWAQQ